MLTAEGAFAASLDADSEGHEGKFYIWTRDEVIDVLGEGEGAFFADVYDITPAGNWEGVSIPNRLAHADRLGEDDERRLAARARRSCWSAARPRVRPATDDKVLADWNGLMIAALAFAGATFGRADWIALAARAFAFVTGAMARDGRLAHSWRAGKSVLPRPRHRLRRHDQGGAGAPRRHTRRGLPRPGRWRSPPPCAPTTGTPTRPATSSPPTTPRR